VKQHKDSSLTIRLPLLLKAALERTAETERRSLSQTVGLAIEQYLEVRGEWPPAGSKQSRSTARRR
jgi:predicted transcriptional regulator